MLHQVPTRGGLIEYELHDPVIAEYLQLLSEPAYLDDVAIVTPVDAASGIQCTAPAATGPTTFRCAVESSVSFLRFLRDSEDRSRDPDQLRPGVDHDAFREALTKNPLPCLLRDDGHRVQAEIGWPAEQRLFENTRRELVEQATLSTRCWRGPRMRRMCWGVRRRPMNYRGLLFSSGPIDLKCVSNQRNKRRLMSSKCFSSFCENERTARSCGSGQSCFQISCLARLNPSEHDSP